MLYQSILDLGNLMWVNHIRDKNNAIAILLNKCDNNYS
jgi:hypothetical protein